MQLRCTPASGFFTLGFPRASITTASGFFTLGFPRLSITTASGFFTLGFPRPSITTSSFVALLPFESHSLRGLHRHVPSGTTGTYRGFSRGLRFPAFADTFYTSRCFCTSSMHRHFVFLGHAWFFHTFPSASFPSLPSLFFSLPAPPTGGGSATGVLSHC